MVHRLFNNRALTAKAICKKVYPANKKNLNMAMKPINVYKEPTNVSSSY
jgi:hypothetical protein